MAKDQMRKQPSTQSRHGQPVISASSPESHTRVWFGSWKLSRQNKESGASECSIKGNTGILNSILPLKHPQSQPCMKEAECLEAKIWEHKAICKEEVGTTGMKKPFFCLKTRNRDQI